MNRKLLVLASVALLGLVAIACGDDDDDDPTASPSPTMTTPTQGATEPATATPSPEDGTRTPEPGRIGDEEVDATIDAVVSGEVAAIVERFEYQSLACEESPGVGGPPPCDTDEAPGTEVDVFPLFVCEGEHMRPDKSEGVLGRWLDNTTAEVYAVASLETDGQSELFPEGEYLLVVTLDREETGPEAFGFGMDADGNIVSAGPRCQATGADILEGSAVDTVLVSPPDGE